MEIACLRSVILDKALLECAYIWQSDLTFSSLQGAILTQANLFGTNLMESNLKGATLSEAKFTNANLMSANLELCTAQGTDFYGAKYNKDTLFPRDIKPKDMGMELHFGFPGK
jgi:uncharacterized protein YjbI with pentapeptide repeats